MRGTGTEPAIGAVRQPCDLAKTPVGDSDRRPPETQTPARREPKFAGRARTGRRLFFHRVADEHQGAAPSACAFAPCMRKNFADLGVAAAAIDLAHQRGKRARPTPSARHGIRQCRENRQAGCQARRSRPPRGTCRPEWHAPCPTSAAGSWWRRARTSAARARRRRRPGQAPSPFREKRRYRRGCDVGASGDLSSAT